MEAGVGAQVPCRGAEPSSPLPAGAERGSHLPPCPGPWKGGPSKCRGSTRCCCCPTHPPAPAPPAQLVVPPGSCPPQQLPPRAARTGSSPVHAAHPPGGSTAAAQRTAAVAARHLPGPAPSPGPPVRLVAVGSACRKEGTGGVSPKCHQNATLTIRVPTGPTRARQCRRPSGSYPGRSGRGCPR